MSLKFNVSGTLKEPSAITANVGGSLKTVTEVWMNNNGTLKKVWPYEVFTSRRSDFNCGTVYSTTINRTSAYSWYVSTKASYSTTAFDMTAAYGRGADSGGFTWYAWEDVWLLSKAKIDLTPYKTLTVSFTYQNTPDLSSYSTYTDFYFIAHSSNTVTTSSDWSSPQYSNTANILINDQSYGSATTVTNKTVNISSITGQKYVGLLLSAGAGDSPRTGTAHVVVTKFELS